MTSSAQDILVSVEPSGVAVVTMNRPAKRNSVTLSMWRYLRTLMLELSARDDVRVIIVTGAGDHFCAGADISEFPALRADAEMGRSYEAAVEAATLALQHCPRPTIAAISGYAMGGGCGLALACDIRLGDASTRMGIPAARLGIIYGAIESSLLYRQVGLANAKRVLYSARTFGPEECAQMRLVDILAPGGARARANALAAEIAGNAPLSLQGAKFVLESLATGTAQARGAEIAAIIDRAMESADYREGARAFLEKRQPAFLGR